MPKIWVCTNVLDINLCPGGDNSDSDPRNKVSLLTLCAPVSDWFLTGLGFLALFWGQGNSCKSTCDEIQKSVSGF